MAISAPMPMEQERDSLLPNHNDFDVSAPETALAILGIPNTPVAVLEHLMNHKHASVRRAVAENPNATVPMLWELAKDEDEAVREIVAERAALLDDVNEGVLLKAEAKSFNA